VLAILAFVAVVGVVLHEQLHSQIDNMLIQLARTEADGALSEYEHGVHVHDTAVRLPALNTEVAEKFSLAFDATTCTVLASTSNVGAEQVPTTWCEGTPPLAPVFNTDAVAGVELRAASFIGETPDGRRITFVSGIAHSHIDGTVRRTLLLVSLAAMVLIGVGAAASYLVARNLTEEIQELSRGCTDLLEQGPYQRESLGAVKPSTPFEIATLAQTVNALLEQLDRMVNLQNQFLAEAAHELRTPLTALRGELELTLRRERSPEEYRESLARALDDTQRLGELADALLEAARTQSEELQLEKVPLPEVVAEALERVRPSLQRAGVAVEENLPEQHCIRGERLAVARVLENLLGNVARHSSASHVRLWIEDGRLHVEDDGVGIDAATRDKLFTPLMESGRGRGHGLGLYITHRLMNKMGGEIELLPGDGCTHWVLHFERA
jgi:two-component system OmpR family sensor kinase